jgi:flavin reductase (DIM6/NTAB) family NADH-FMN oxidoreductase RutF
MPPHNTASDARWFRDVLAHYPTGVSIVTGLGPDGAPEGFAVGTFTSVSLEPPLVAFLPARTSTSWPRIAPSGRFCVNVLGDHQEEICRAFAITAGSLTTSKFDSVAWRPSASGVPILEGAVAWVECEQDAVHDAGDHLIVVGRVLDLGADPESSPLVFLRGGYRRFAPVPPPPAPAPPGGA